MSVLLFTTRVWVIGVGVLVLYRYRILGFFVATRSVKFGNLEPSKFEVVIADKKRAQTLSIQPWVPCELGVEMLRPSLSQPARK